MSGPPTVSSESGSRPGVLRTKLAAPGLRPGLLPRTALLDQLDAVVVPGRLSLMVAGAGWGKSTLLAQWHQRDSRPECFAWFCVDTDDNDPRRFWAHVLAAVAPLGEGLTALSTQLLMTPGTNIVDDVAPALINELTTVGVPATLVVDDYHLISNTEIHAAMAVLAAHVPRTLRLVISGRSQPPLPLTRLRGSGRLVDINVEELRLSADETRELIKRELPGRLTSEEIALLHERTEGWVTGLHLAVLSLRRHPDPERLIREFAGTDRNIGDYLLTEVLEQQPPDVRSFLRATSILKRFSAPLANAVTARADSVDLLRRVERDQLFLIPLDNRGEWHRYHHLFADVLAADLARVEPELVPELHGRAARWHSDHDSPVEAVQHALASADMPLAADLVALNGMAVCLQGQVQTVLGWFAALGEPACRVDARLCLIRALVAGTAGEVVEMERWADLAEQAAAGAPLPADLVASVQSGVALARWASSYFSGDVAASVRHARAALAPRADDQTLQQANTALGWSLFRQGEFREAQGPLAEAAALSTGHGDDLNVIVTRGVQAIIAAASGLAHEAETRAAEAERTSQRHAAGEHSNAWGSHFARAWLAMARDAYEQAHEHLQRALQLVRRGPQRLETVEVLTALAITERQLGRLDSARPYLDEARAILDQCRDPGRLLADPRTIRLPRRSSASVNRTTNLSNREVEVLGLVGEGLTTDEIARRLRLSPRTVDAHLRSIYRQINVKTRSAATRYAIAHRLTSPPAAPP